MDEIRRHAALVAKDITPIRAAAVRSLGARPNGREWHDWKEDVKARIATFNGEGEGARLDLRGGDPLFEFHPIGNQDYWCLTTLGRAVFGLLSTPTVAEGKPNE